MASSEFQKKASGMLVTILIGLIVISFMFSGYQSFRFSSNAVGSVGDYPIEIKEYETTLNNTIRYYSQMMGGRNLTSKDIERFGIRQQVIRKLVNMKLQLTLTDYLHIYPSAKEVADQIQKLPYFLDNGVFSLKKYKMLLRNNGLTPKNFESTVREDMKLKVLQETFGKVPLSQTYLTDLKNFKSKRFSSVVVSFTKDEIKQNLPIRKSEIKKFLSNKENLAKVEKLFNERKEQLSTKEAVEVSHILLKGQSEDIKKKALDLRKKLTPKNFAAMAKKYTEDPSGKNNGGDLGKFTRGRMVKAFEDTAFSMKVGTISPPIKTQFGYHILWLRKKYPAKVAKFNQFKEQLATGLIRNKADDRAKQTMEELSIKFNQLFEKNDIKGIKKLAKRYNIPVEQDQEFNMLDGYLGKLKLSKDLLADIFKADLNKKKVFSIAPQNKLTIVRVTPKKDSEKEKKDEKYIVAGQEFLLTKTLMTDMLDKLREKVKVHIRKEILN